jgi:hypothetical protein
MMAADQDPEIGSARLPTPQVDWYGEVRTEWVPTTAVDEFKVAHSRRSWPREATIIFGGVALGTVPAIVPTDRSGWVVGLVTVEAAAALASAIVWLARGPRLDRAQQALNTNRLVRVERYGAPLLPETTRMGRRYGTRILCIALCQGAALHYVDGRNGIKDFDVYVFFAEHPQKEFPYRRHAFGDFGKSRFGRTPGYEGRRVDLFGRSLEVRRKTHAIEAIRPYLTKPRTATARHLARKAVVVLDPPALRGRIAWRPEDGNRS